MVKIQTRIIRKKYKRSKPPYTYKQHLLPFPLTENQRLQPFLKKRLDIEMKIKDDTINLTLKKQDSEESKNEKS